MSTYTKNVQIYNAVGAILIFEKFVEMFLLTSVDPSFVCSDQQDGDSL